MEMSGWRAVFEADMYRYGASKVDKYIKKWNYFFRRCQYASGGGKKIIWHLLLLKHGTKHGIEIDYNVEISDCFPSGKRSLPFLFFFVFWKPGLFCTKKQMMFF